MYKVVLRKTNLERRKLRVRKKISGSVERPRLSVFRSNKYLYGQVIDDVAGKTLASINTLEAEAVKGKTKSQAAFEAGKALAEKAKEQKIVKLTFDRNGYKYHGRIKSFADGLREGGIEI